MPDCKECKELESSKDLQAKNYSTRKEDKEIINAVFFDFKQLAIKWWKHFNSKPNLMNMASCRTIADIFDLSEDDLK